MMIAQRARMVSILDAAAMVGCSAGVAPLDPLLAIKSRLAEVSADVDANDKGGLAASAPFRVDGRLRFNEGPAPGIGPIVVKVVTNRGGKDVTEDSAIAVIDHHDADMLTFHASIRAPPKPGPCRVKIIHMAELLTSLDLSVRSL